MFKIAVDGGGTGSAVAASHPGLISKQALYCYCSRKGALRAIDGSQAGGLDIGGIDAGYVELAVGVVVFGDCAVWKFDNGFICRLAGLWELVGGHAAQDDAVGGLAAGGEHNAILADAGRAVHGHAAGGGHEIRQPIGGEAAVQHAHAAGCRVAFGNRALLDEVGEQAGEFGGVHGAARKMDVCRLCRRYRARAVVGWFEGIFYKVRQRLSEISGSLFDIVLFGGLEHA
nr:MAG TPA: hypothetical protein [Caudoviricetes sp.]